MKAFVLLFLIQVIGSFLMILALEHISKKENSVLVQSWTYLKNKLTTLKNAK